jgi:hypothetical protein
MPISARLVSSGNMVSALVVLDYLGHYDFLIRARQNVPSVDLDIADSLIIDDNTTGQTVIPTGNFSIPNVSDLGLWDTMHGSIGVAFNTSFARRFERFIITPSGHGEEGLLVLDPITPEQYAYEGQWFYVNSLCDQHPVIEASVFVGNHSASSRAVFALVSTSLPTSIPPEAFQIIVGHVERAGFIIVNRTLDNLQVNASTAVRLGIPGNYETLYIPRLCASELAQILPPIHFEIVSGTQRFRITIFPEDYIKPFANGHTLTIMGFSVGGLYAIGTNMLRRLALQIEPENHRIRFAEPVIEI